MKKVQPTQESGMHRQDRATLEASQRAGGVEFGQGLADGLQHGHERFVVVAQQFDDLGDDGHGPVSVVAAQAVDCLLYTSRCV